MKKMFIIAPYPKDAAPSQRFRFEQYLKIFEQQGFKIYFHSFLSERTWKRIYKDGNSFQKALGFFGAFLRRWLLLFKIPMADVVFIHREAAQMGPPIFEWIIAKVLRKKYIYDFDDAIWLPNYSESNARYHRLKAYWKVNYCMKWAGTVIAGNDYLADYAKRFNANVVIIPTTIDTENYHNQTIDYADSNLSIGWTGSHTTMQYLPSLVPILKELEERYTFEFIVISNQKPDFDLKSLRYIPWKKESEIEDLLKIKIGVMPLAPDRWSNGKCGFKALQYMSLGIPTILSPVGVNSVIVQDEINGFFASSPNEWKQHLEQLLVSRELREKVGKAGQEVIVNRYSVLSQSSTYLSILKSYSA
jgi:glycosyltransferase involved in cell wall biosynthesis